VELVDGGVGREISKFRFEISKEDAEDLNREN
jgi:hypothetical protein